MWIDQSKPIIECVSRTPVMRYIINWVKTKKEYTSTELKKEVEQMRLIVKAYDVNEQYLKG